MQLFRQPLLILLLLALIITSCNDGDDEAPTIEITAPANGATLNVDSGLFVSFTTSDNKKVEYISFKLFNTNTKEYVNSNYTYYVNKDYEASNFFYPINEDFVSSNYYLEATAFDGENSKVTSVDLRLNYTGYSYRGTVYSSSNSNSCLLKLVAPSGAITNFAQQNVSCAGFALDKKRETYIILERNAPRITSYSIKDNSINWSESFSASGGTYEFSKLAVIDDLIYCLNFTNQIFRYDYTGQARGVIGTVYQPITIKKIGSFLYTIEKRRSDQAYYIGQYGITGAFVSNRELNMAATDLDAAGGGNVYIIGNSSGKGRLMEFKVQVGALNFITNFNYSVSSCFSYRNKFYFNSADNGNFYEFSLNMTDGIRKAQNVYADAFAVDEKREVLYFNSVFDNGGYQMNLNDFSTRQVLNGGSKVTDFRPYYKK
jgi:hypothetical protein